ncbi:PrgI family protein [Candidatus Woesearchaeota archaeon]|nr:PrgI family protein [Candidatus Woesearchaeota archaeon]
MSYEIPQQLEYKEKIIFGLTFQQLLYALIFSPLALALLFKTPYAITYRIGLALIPSALACIFIFTKIPLHSFEYHTSTNYQ